MSKLALIETSPSKAGGELQPKQRVSLMHFVSERTRELPTN